MEEDQATQDARVEKLWKALDTKQQGQLDLEALKKGLTTINHREKSILNDFQIATLITKQHSRTPILSFKTSSKRLIRIVMEAYSTAVRYQVRYTGLQAEMAQSSGSSSSKPSGNCGDFSRVLIATTMVNSTRENSWRPLKMLESDCQEQSWINSSRR